MDIRRFLSCDEQLAAGFPPHQHGWGAEIDIGPRGIRAVRMVERFDVAGCRVGIIGRVLMEPHDLSRRDGYI